MQAVADGAGNKDKVEAGDKARDKDKFGAGDKDKLNEKLEAGDKDEFEAADADNFDAGDKDKLKDKREAGDKDEFEAGDEEKLKDKFEAGDKDKIEYSLRGFQDMPLFDFYGRAVREPPEPPPPPIKIYKHPKYGRVRDQCYGTHVKILELFDHDGGGSTSDGGHGFADSAPVAATPKGFFVRLARREPGTAEQMQQLVID